MTVFLSLLSLITTPVVFAQEDNDPVSQVRSMVEKGNKSLTKAQSVKRASRNKRRRRKKLKLLKEALKSFSGAHRYIIGLQLEDEELRQTVEEGLITAHKESIVKVEMKKLEKSLTKALTEKDYNKVYQIADELQNLDARRKEFEYITRIVAKLVTP